MEKFLPILKETALFSNMKDPDILAMLSCLSAKEITYTKDQFIFHYGDTFDYVGLVLTGSVHIIKEDFWGNRTILTDIYPAHLFGEAYACIPTATSENSAIAATNCTLLLLDIRKLLSVCTKCCSYHTLLIQNFLTELAGKTILLSKKIEHISQRSTREKLLSYLSTTSLKVGASSFEISLNRQQLADYLSIDRSAMSNELSKLRNDGILTFYKSKFTLL